jgi:hypothetical protein
MTNKNEVVLIELYGDNYIKILHRGALCLILCNKISSWALKIEEILLLG